MKYLYASAWGGAGPTCRHAQIVHREGLDPGAAAVGLKRVVVVGHSSSGGTVELHGIWGLSASAQVCPLGTRDGQVSAASAVALKPRNS